MEHGQIISISEHEIVDCDYNNEGCKSGNIRKALVSVINFLFILNVLNLNKTFMVYGIYSINCRQIPSSEIQH